MRPRRLRFIPLAALALALAAGCEEKMHVAGSKPAKPAEDKFIVGKRTQDIVKFDPNAEVKKGGTVASQKITARDPITLPGNAYVTIIGQSSILSIQHAMNLYKATNDRFPKDYDEFMTDIVKANNIALPKLPEYQKYAYDENEHKLVVIEYPELKASLAK